MKVNVGPAREVKAVVREICSSLGFAHVNLTSKVYMLRIFVKRIIGSGLLRVNRPNASRQTLPGSSVLIRSSGGFAAQFKISQTVFLCKIPDHPSRTVSGIPNCVIRLSTAYFTNASVRWVFEPRAQSRPPNNLLNRNIVFSATL